MSNRDVLDNVLDTSWWLVFDNVPRRPTELHVWYLALEMVKGTVGVFSS